MSHTLGSESDTHLEGLPELTPPDAQNSPANSDISSETLSPKESSAESPLSNTLPPSECVELEHINDTNMIPTDYLIFKSSSELFGETPKLDFDIASQISTTSPYQVQMNEHISSTAGSGNVPQHTRTLDREKENCKKSGEHLKVRSLSKEKKVSSTQQGSIVVPFISMALLSIAFTPILSSLLLCCLFSSPRARAGARYGLSLGFLLWGGLILVTQFVITPRKCRDLFQDFGLLYGHDVSEYIKKGCQAGSLVLLVLGGLHLLIGVILLCTTLLKRKKIKLEMSSS
jgi:hypothetical protein